ncbi:hypothetical protein LLG95_03080 [bacterium]|nr:hypothetical protein [bacterium]
MNADIISLSEMLDVHADRCFSELPVDGVNGVFGKEQLQFCFGAGICRGTYMRHRSQPVKGSCLVIGKSRSDFPSSQPFQPITLHEEPVVWIAKQFAQPFCEDVRLSEHLWPDLADLEYALSGDHHCAPHKIIPPELINKYVTVLAPDCFEFTNLAYTENHAIHWWTRLRNIEEQRKKERVKVVGIYGEGTSVVLDDLVSIPFMTHANGNPPIMQGLFNLNNPHESVFQVPQVEKLVFDKAFTLVENLHQWLATFSVDLSTRRPDEVELCTVRKADEHELLGAIEQLAIILANTDTEESLAKAREMKVKSSQPQLTKLRNQVVNRLTAEKESIDCLVKELGLGHKRTRAMVMGFAGIMVVMAIETILVMMHK